MAETLPNMKPLPASRDWLLRNGASKVPVSESCEDRAGGGLSIIFGNCRQSDRRSNEFADAFRFRCPFPLDSSDSERICPFL